MAEGVLAGAEPRTRRITPVAGALAAIVALALVLRIIRLMTLFPILVDESIYLRWAEIIDHQGQWFVSLLDAKQPLSYWLYALLRKVFVDADPLLGARLVSVGAGVFSVLLLFDLGRRLAGPPAGLAAALFAALLPYGVFYDRLAYTDALVNCFGLAVAVASVACFRDRPTVGRAVTAGLILGLALFTKMTVLPFALLPAAAALMWRRESPLLAGKRLLLIYAVAAGPPLISSFAVPRAPTFAINNLIVHHTSFFTPFDVLIERPTVNLLINGVLLVDYLMHYVTGAFALAACAAAAFLAVRREPAAVFVVAVTLVPLALQLLLLEYFPSRYVYPHIWPLLLAAGVAIARLSAASKAAAAALVVILLIPLTVATARLLRAPQRALQAIDFAEFLSSGPFSGYGIREAVAYLQAEAARSPFTLLTDPIWGTPADAFYPYLNHRHGIRVYDAWWVQLSDREPLLPRGPREVMKSQYERVADGVVDFARLDRVFYVTDTNYQTPADVGRRQPDARLVARFPKPNGRDSIDVYRLTR